MSRQDDRVKTLEGRRASQRATAAGWSASRWLATLEMSDAMRQAENRAMMRGAGMSADAIDRWQGIAERARRDAAEALALGSEVIE